MPKKNEKNVLKFLIVGFLLISIGVVFKVFEPFTKIVRDQYAIKPGKYLFKVWRKLPGKVLVNVYLFNVTNAEEFLSGKQTKLELSEVGPYVYQEFIEHKNPTFNENGTITYQIYRYVKPHKTDTSADPFNDIIYTPNLILLGGSTFAAKHSKVGAYGFTLLAKYLKSKPILKMTVQELLWGFEDKMYELASEFVPSLASVKKFGLMAKMFDEGENIVTMYLPESKDISENQQNENLNEQNEVVTVQTSTTTISKTVDFEYEDDYEFVEETTEKHNLEVYEADATSKALPLRRFSINLWNGSPFLPNFENIKSNSYESCAKIQGACDGSLFPENISKNSKFKVFRKSFCRLFPIYFAKEGEYLGIHAYWFELSENAFHDNTNDPDTSCYCDNEKTCLKKGLGNVAQCYFGLPMAISQPHFFNADRSLLNEVEGMNPNEDKHQSGVIIQPQLGFAMHGFLRAQVNLLTGNLNFNKDIERFSNMVLPIVWVEIAVDKLPWHLEIVLILAFKILPPLQSLIFIICIPIGLCLVVFAIFLSCQRKKVKTPKQNETPLLKVLK